jgi:CRISPR/Cas system Type II protein with McrA/HNH and RuvC-like nuclease domain
MKTCTKCNETLPMSEFTMTSRGYKPSCKSCERQRVRQWSADNPDKERAKSARRRARGGDVTFDLSVRQKLFEDQSGRCFYTDVKLELTTAHIDHKVPISRGGTNDFSNLALCTPEANLLKHNKTDEEFIAWFTDKGLFQN